MAGHTKNRTGLAAPDLNLDAIVDRFEESWRTNGDADIDDYLPPPDCPNYPEILLELIRLDLEIRWKKGEQPRVEDYLEGFADSEFSPQAVEQLAYEE